MSTQNAAVFLCSMYYIVRGSLWNTKVNIPFLLHEIRRIMENQCVGFPNFISIMWFFSYVYHDCEFNYRLPGNNSSGGQLISSILTNQLFYIFQWETVWFHAASSATLLYPWWTIDWLIGKRKSRKWNQKNCNLHNKRKTILNELSSI